MHGGKNRDARPCLRCVCFDVFIFSHCGALYIWLQTQTHTCTQIHASTDSQTDPHAHTELYSTGGGGVIVSYRWWQQGHMPIYFWCFFLFWHHNMSTTSDTVTHCVRAELCSFFHEMYGHDWTLIYANEGLMDTNNWMVFNALLNYLLWICVCVFSTDLCWFDASIYTVCVS